MEMRSPVSELRDTLLARLSEAYTAYFDVEPVQDGSPLKSLCAYHSRGSQYVLIKKAELWAAETHEYLYLYSLPRLDFTSLVELQARTLEDGMPRIRPHSQHMCTYLSAVVLCDQADPDALAQLQKLKKHRDFKLSLHGWMEFRIAAVDLSTGDIATNRSGKDLGKSLSGLVAREIQKFKLRRGET